MVDAVRATPDEVGSAGLRHVTSADGTRIALEQLGDGPRTLITVPGGAHGRRVWAGVARDLDGVFAVWAMDRRGRGDSGDTEPYSFDREHEDLRAVAGAFGPDVVVAAHSSGAVCLLGAAVHGLPARALVVYEPPWPLAGRVPTTDALDEMDAHLAAGDREAVLETALRRLVELPPAAIEAIRAAPGWAERVRHAHTWPREGRELDRMLPGAGPLATIGTPTLVLRGELSPDHLRASTTAVAEALPHAEVVELAGQGHGALQTAPGLVADALRRHLS